jgi:hypothetical protein
MRIGIKRAIADKPENTIHDKFTRNGRINARILMNCVPSKENKGSATSKSTPISTTINVKIKIKILVEFFSEKINPCSGDFFPNVILLTIAISIKKDMNIIKNIIPNPIDPLPIGLPSDLTIVENNAIGRLLQPK